MAQVFSETALNQLSAEVDRQLRALKERSLPLWIKI